MSNDEKLWYKMIMSKRFQGFVVQLMSLLFVNGFALIYDAQWIQYAIGVDAFILGVNITDLIRR